MWVLSRFLSRDRELHVRSIYMNRIRQRIIWIIFCLCQVTVITNRYQIHDDGGEDQAAASISCNVCVCVCVCTYVCMYVCIYVFICVCMYVRIQNSLLSSILRKTYVIHRALQEESAVLRENVLSLISLYSKLSCYGGNIARKVWSSCVSTYSACVT